MTDKIKVLLMTNYADNITDKLYNNRYEYLSYIIYKYLSNYSDLNLFVTKCFNNNDVNTNINNYILPESDFIIIIDDRHFVNRSMNHINHYKKNNKFMIITINNNNYINVCENLAIYLDPVCDIGKLNTLYMDYGWDNNLLYQLNTNDNNIYVTIYGSFTGDTKNIDKIIDDLNNTNIITKNIVTNKITNKNDIINYPTNVLIITDDINDNLLLIELALIGVTIIVNPTIFLDEHLIEKLFIVTYDDVIWENVLDKYNDYGKCCITHNITWSNNIAILYDVIKNNYKVATSVIQNSVSKSSGPKHVLIQSSIRN